MDELTGEQLASMFSSLQKLDLRGNQLSDGAVAKFAQAFRQQGAAMVGKTHQQTVTKECLESHPSIIQTTYGEKYTLYSSALLFSRCIVSPTNSYYHRRRVKTEEKAKVVAVVLGDVLECRTNHLAARMI